MRTSKSMPSIAKVERLVTLLPGEMHRPWTPNRLSRVAGVSESHLRRLFLELMGEPPMRWLKRLRLITARELLLESPLPVRRVAATVGCRDFSHFVRDFREVFGMSPATYRRTVGTRTRRSHKNGQNGHVRRPVRGR